MFAAEKYRIIVEVVDVQGLIWPALTLAERSAAAARSTAKARKLPNPYVDVLVGGTIYSFENNCWLCERFAAVLCSVVVSALVVDRVVKSVLKVFMLKGDCSSDLLDAVSDLLEDCLYFKHLER